MRTFYILLNIAILFSFTNVVLNVVRMKEKSPVYKVTIVKHYHNHIKKHVIDTPFSEAAFKKYLKQIRIKYPETAFAQAKLESSNFTSKLFKNNNNLFGMQVAQKRVKTCERHPGVYAKYTSWKLSVLDYAFFQRELCVGSKEDLYSKLNKYSKDEEYIKKIKILEKEF